MRSSSGVSGPNDCPFLATWTQDSITKLYYDLQILDDFAHTHWFHMISIQQTTQFLHNFPNPHVCPKFKFWITSSKIWTKEGNGEITTLFDSEILKRGHTNIPWFDEQWKEREYAVLRGRSFETLEILPFLNWLKPVGPFMRIEWRSCAPAHADYFMLLRCYRLQHIPAPARFSSLLWLAGRACNAGARFFDVISFSKHSHLQTRGPHVQLNQISELEITPLFVAPTSQTVQMNS